MNYLLILVIAIPVLFIIGTTYNALKEILAQREQEKKLALKNSSNKKNKNTKDSPSE